MVDTFEEQLRKNHGRNTVWNTIDACFYQVALTCSIPGVIIVAFLKHYTDSQMILNLPIFIGSFANSLVPFLMSFISGKLKRKKPPVVILGSLQRFLWIIVLLSVVYFSENPKILLPMFFLGYAVYELLSGSVDIFWQELMGRALLPGKLSSAMGIRESISRVAGFFTSLLTAFLLSRYAFPHNFIILFAIAFFGNMGSIFSLNMLHEASYDTITPARPINHLKNMLVLPVKDKTFYWFSVFSIFSSGHLFIGGLYTSVGIERFKGMINQDELAGVISIITLLAGSALSYIMGKYCEKYGKYKSLLIITLGMTFSPLWAAACVSLYGYLAVFAFSSISVALMIVNFSAILDFGKPEKRHEYIAFISLVRILPIVVFTNLGGYLTDRFSPELTFILSAIFSLGGFFVLVLKLGPLWKREEALKFNEAKVIS